MIDFYVGSEKAPLEEDGLRLQLVSKGNDEYHVYKDSNNKCVASFKLEFGDELQARINKIVKNSENFPKFLPKSIYDVEEMLTNVQSSIVNFCVLQETFKYIKKYAPETYDEITPLFEMLTKEVASKLDLCKDLAPAWYGRDVYKFPGYHYGDGNPYNLYNREKYATTETLLKLAQDGTNERRDIVRALAHGSTMFGMENLACAAYGKNAAMALNKEFSITESSAKSSVTPVNEQEGGGQE